MTSSHFSWVISNTVKCLCRTSIDASLDVVGPWTTMNNALSQLSNQTQQVCDGSCADYTQLVRSILHFNHYWISAGAWYGSGSFLFLYWLWFISSWSPEHWLHDRRAVQSACELKRLLNVAMVNETKYFSISCDAGFNLLLIFSCDPDTLKG